MDKPLWIPIKMFKQGGQGYVLQCALDGPIVFRTSIRGQMIQRRSHAEQMQDRLIQYVVASIVYLTKSMHFRLPVGPEWRYVAVPLM